MSDTAAVTPRVNVADALLEQARLAPQRVAIRTPRPSWGWSCLSRNSRPECRTYGECTFGSLEERVLRRALGLRRLKIGEGVRAALMVPPSQELVELVFALFHVGAVPVLIDPGMGLKNIGKCLAEAAPAVFIGIPKAQVVRSLAGWGRASVRQSITVGRFTGWWGGTSWNELWEPFHPGSQAAAHTTADTTAAILFTSGSTGVPKGAVYTHGIFVEQVRQLQSLFQIEPGEVDLCTFPLFALFGPALGMTSIIPVMDSTRPAHVNPREIFGPAERFGVTNLFGSPALLNRVSTAATGQRLPRVRRVLSAGAPVSPRILENMAELLPAGTQIFTPYGATEALPVAVIGSHEVLGETRGRTADGAGTCVGRPVTGLDVRVIRITDEPVPQWSDDLVLPPGEIGEIAVFGPQVTQEYFERPDLTALAKIPDASRGRKWHRMGDLGYFDEQGRLWFCGRKSQRVCLAHQTLFTDPVEGIFNAHPEVFRSALVGVDCEGATKPVVWIERRLTGMSSGRQRTEAALVEELLAIAQQRSITQPIRTFFVHPAFPVDIRHNSKIFREKLAALAAQRLGGQPHRPGHSEPAPSDRKACIDVPKR